MTKIASSFAGRVFNVATCGNKQATFLKYPDLKSFIMIVLIKATNVQTSWKTNNISRKTHYAIRLLFSATYAVISGYIVKPT